MNLYAICYIFLLFIIYSFLGWCVEVINSFLNSKGFVNRGFLIGPYCPIYGVGLLLIIYFLKEYTDSYLVVFVMSMFICMILEYFTSYVMEKLFNARWWDYSHKKFNINGRICLETTIPFGLGGMGIIYIVNPLIEKVLSYLSSNGLIIIGIIVMIIFFSDLVVSFITVMKVKNVKITKIKDNTEEINKKVKEYLIKNSVLTRRLIHSFPNFKIDVIKLKERIMKKR